jgi:superfamily II DNA/RNA helicase
LKRGQGDPLTLTFAQLGVPEKIVKALDRRGITQPFEIQAATIADALEGRDVCGRAPTGSGKTIAFGIPLVVKVGRAEPRRPRALVLAPTRELAEQITTEMRTFAGPVRIHAVYGGVGYGPQYNALRQGVDILVACPGRLEDLITQKALKLDDVDLVVIDEADRMADMGFMPSVRRLLDQTAEDRQTMMYSATLDGDVAKLTRDYQTDAVRHEVGEETPDITSASHVFWKVNRANRNDIIAEAVNAVWPAIVFCRTRHGSDRLAKHLESVGIKAGAIHGGRSQNQRMRALAEFSKGKMQALVASDVAARGIHVDNVASVVHFDPPDDHKTYVHRSGRTARAGQGGVVLSLVLPEQARDAQRMMRQVGIDAPFITPDAVALRELSPAPLYKAAPSPKPAEPIVDDRSELEPWDDRIGGRPNSSDKPHSSPQSDSRPSGPRPSGPRPSGPRRNLEGGSRSYGSKNRSPSFGRKRDSVGASGSESDRTEQRERPAFDPSKRSVSDPAKRPFKSGGPSYGARPGQGVRPFQGARPGQAKRQGNDSREDTAAASRPRTSADSREGARSGTKPWESRKANQVGRSSAPQRKDFSDRPFASGPPTRKIRRTTSRTKSAK